MLNQELLLDLTESYLKSLVAEASSSVGTDFDSSVAFGELGVDSFRVLKIIKGLEADFGTLPKTLLFENFNVESLTRYFVDKHADALSAKFSKEQAVAVSAPAAAAAVSVTPITQTAPAVAKNASAPVRKTALRLLESDLPRYPALEALVKELFDAYKNDGAVSRGTRNIAPNLFIGSERKGYFNYSRCRNIVLIYAYTGPADYFPKIAGEMQAYCTAKNFQLNIFVDEVIESIDGVRFSSTPFGALQRVVNLQQFTLEGSAMKRLRYQIGKFEKAGACRTHEYRCGTDETVDRAIAGIIDRWCATKTMVNPLIHIVREEILAGTLHPQHRIFLTYVDDVLQNVILISELSAAHNGYLMDLEFYSKDMPLGGLEFAIVKIIETLVAEGRDMLSLGGTYGCRLEASDSADADVDRILDDLHKQNIFNDEGNLQFKNKFRPENRTIFLCRPADSGNADSVIDIIMMIADPAKAQTSDEENHNVEIIMAADSEPAAAVANASNTLGSRLGTEELWIEGEPRSRILAEYGFNPFDLPGDQVEFDLKTDSWAQLDTPYVEKQMAHLRSQLQQPVNVNDALKTVFPFRHLLLTDAGRTAERLLCEAWPRKGIVLQNLLFPTGIYHQIDKGFTPCELPHPDAFQLDADRPYKGGLNLSALQERVARQAKDIAFAWVEVSDNGTGGHPISLHQLRQIKETLAAHSIPLVIDGTRVLENAQYLIEHEAGHAGKSIWAMAREILACADVVTGSLAKDFGVNKGGLIATNDEALFHRMQALLQQEGGGLDVIEKKLIGLSLQNPRQLETRIARRVAATGTIWRALKGQGVPVVQPAGGHCVLIDVKRIAEFSTFAHPVASFVAWMYLNTGIRAGAHSVGMQQNSVLNGLVRLAVPAGVKPDEAETIAQRLVRLFAERKNIPELASGGETPEPFGDVHARYRLVRYHNASANLVSGALRPADEAEPASSVAAPRPALQASGLPGSERAEPKQIAVVGIAGRYPKAKTQDEFWENLRQGRDCVGDLPQDRLARRVQNGYTRQYRGGFIDDVDRFDSLFFNISPREAEVLDPQERLFLEVAWEAIEDAGYYPEILSSDASPRNVGVFVGAVWAMYQIAGVEHKLAGNNLNPNSFLWSIANRVSYWMNLSGPSLTVDTACSSSLTALQLACESIRNGDCSSAIVGGVNLDLHQHKFDINFAGGALSSDGVCRSFGAGANGYVAGEGVGAIFIKPLDRALQDGDQIYGVIRSAVVNHGGRTSGYTVPNPKAQGELVAAAIEKAGVDAASIGYVEAHGTGTELGDPIEVSGLTNAFASSQVERQSCAIGSVKTNIGHLEAAAGIVGVCKVLLQMKYRQLVPSLHSGELNGFIDFENSPFYVQQRLEDWQPKERDGIRLPLRAGVSSFGAGGANAHVVIEQHLEAPSDEAVPADGYVFPLSARNDEQLREMAARLLAHLERDFVVQRLDDIAFTLQNGRKSFEHRLAIVARTQPDLLAKLRLFLDGGRDADVLSGHARNSDGMTRLLSRKEKEQFVALLSQSRDPHKLAQLWIDGLLSDCRGFQQSGRRTSLPTYPFADKRHWIAASAAEIAPALPSVRASIHPLIDSNESTFQRQLFKKTFHQDEFFLRDHVVSGVPTLPGTAYLDMARKAGEIAAGRKVQKIRNVTWVSPLSVEGAASTDAFIELKPNADSVLFEVFSEDTDGKRRLHSQGKLLYAEEDAPAEVEYLDIDKIRSRCVSVAVADQAYPMFSSVGMGYGPSFQVLQEVFRNDDEVLGVLRLPQLRDADFEQFLLHPCLLDASMQAGIAAQLGDRSGEMKVPYSLGEVELLHPLTRTCYSYVTRGKNDRGSGSGVSRDDVVIADEAGKVLARIREAVGVPLVNVHEKPVQARQEQEEEFPSLYYAPTWVDAPISARDSDVGSIVLFDVDDRLFAACDRRNVNAVLVLPGDRFEQRGDRTYSVNPAEPGDYARLFESLAQSSWPVEKICYAWAERMVPTDEAELRRALERGVSAFLSLCQALIDRKPSARTQLLYLYSGETPSSQPHNDAINGFARSLSLENPKIDCKVLELLGEHRSGDEVVSMLLAELDSRQQEAATVRYDGRSRHTRTLKKLDLAVAEPAAEVALKHHGVYLITGGAGGLGLIFAEYLARRCQARLVLTGRSELSPQRQAPLEGLKAAGADVVYIAADVSNREDAKRVIDESKARFGSIDGIVHSAGVLRDSFLRKKTQEDLEAVLAPKVYGTFHLDELTQHDDLDFFVLFSSLAAIGGNTGQCDYAFANHYMDAFASRREMLRAQGSRFGRTLSVNWSLWADGGMKLDEQTELFFRKNLGIKPLSKTVGLDAFVRGLQLAHPQIAVLEGVQAKIELAWGLAKKEPIAPAALTAAEAQVPAPSGGDDGLVAAVIKELSKTVVDMLKLHADDLSLDSILLDLGFDSIGLTTFANAINDTYRLDINPVLFFEYPSIRAIAGVLCAEHGDAVRTVHAGLPSVAAKTVQAKAPESVQTAKSGQPLPLAMSKQWEAPAPAVATIAQPVSRERRFIDEPIAIVGIGGIMPQSENLEAFWENLRDARDLVTEIPRDRWIWEDYHGNPLKEVNKSYSKWGGFIRDVDKFDPLFFGITPREAEMMDPQQRIFIETVWAAIEDAGHKVSDLAGTKTGLFVGASAKDYIDVLAEHQSALDGYSASGNSHSILANRVSYLFNLRGPSAPLDTACSSSLIALHRAIESIHTGSSDMAIVGGVQVMLTPVAHISLSSAGMLSPDGKCRTFNKDANGYVRGEGAGAILIKPLAKAEADGNPIYAVIKATAENHGGRVTNLTAPNPKAQAELLTEAYEKAHIDPTTVGYIECHGTGTSLGDPIEIQALKKSFSDLYRKHGKTAATEPHCGLSSVKTNIGHLEPAAGIASLLKVLLAMKHKQIPALLHFEELNPYIDLKGSPFYIVDKTVPWVAARTADGKDLPRRAGVSSFGWGGANAHVVLEEYLSERGRSDNAIHAPLPIVLSAKSGDRLKAYARSMANHLRKNDVDLADFAYTLQIGRDVMTERLGILASSTEELIAKLDAYAAGDGSVDGVYQGKVGRNKDDINLIGQDDDIRDSVVEKLVSGGKWSKLLELWTKGLDLDWAKLHADGSLGGGRPMRISLPTYPFARERYWIDTTSKKQVSAASTQAEKPKQERQVPALEASQHLYFKEEWREQDEPVAHTVSSGHRVIVFADQAPRDGEGATGKTPLDDTVTVYRADSCEKVSDGTYRARFDDASDLRTILSEMAAESGRPLEIVYAWSRGKGRQGVHALFKLFTAIKELQHPVARVTLMGEYDPARVETCWDYSWIGFERSLKLHLAKTEISLVYADSSELSIQRARNASQSGGVVWYRGGKRLVLSNTAFDPAMQAKTPELKQGGAYLITGGAGALGLKFAHWLAANYHAKLVLMGRKPLSSDIQAKLDALTEAGALEAHYQSIDLADTGALTEWAQSLPFALSGVIHAAGVESEQAFFDKSPVDIDQVLNPKASGSMALDEALVAHPLDFVCYFSSSSALLGDFGSCDYAIANRFQMAYGHFREHSASANGKTLVINWPLWREGGMGVADPAQTLLYLKRTGLDALETEDGLGIWRDLMSASAGQVLVMAGKPSRIAGLLDKIYRVPASTRPPLINVPDETNRIDTFISDIKSQAGAYNAKRLSDRQIDKIRRLIKADLMKLQETGK